ncbi:hypothetical protein CKA32_006889 [Geitlerinema sp. FC II]|nr:hypothetical protein CKA32_006889 [Geitlerinema sp. FC II]
MAGYKKRCRSERITNLGETVQIAGAIALKTVEKHGERDRAANFFPVEFVKIV